MIKTVIVISDTCVRCGGSSGPEVIPGDTVLMWLDQEAVPEFPETVSGVVMVVEPQVVSSTAPKHYTIQYESDDLNDVAAALRDCDVISVTCAGCCALINDYLDLLASVNLPHVSLGYAWNEDGTFTLQAHAYSTQMAGNPSALATIATYVFTDPEAAVIAAGGDPDSRVVTPTDTGEVDWPGGTYTVTVTDSEGLTNAASVWVAPKPRYRTVEAVIASGDTEVDVDLAAGEFICGALAALTTEFYMFSTTNDTLYVSAAPATDLHVIVTIKIP